MAIASSHRKCLIIAQVHLKRLVIGQRPRR